VLPNRRLHVRRRGGTGFGLGLTVRLLGVGWGSVEFGCSRRAAGAGGALGQPPRRHLAPAAEAARRPPPAFTARLPPLLDDGAAEGAEVGHADLASAVELVEGPGQAVLSGGVVAAAPLPEELLDVRDVGAAGDVLNTAVVDADDGLADEGLPLQVGQL